METLFSLMPIVLALVALAVGALVWAIRSGQFDDLEGPAYRILYDDDDPRIPFNRPKDGGEQDKAEQGPADQEQANAGSPEEGEGQDRSRT